MSIDQVARIPALQEGLVIQREVLKDFYGAAAGFLGDLVPGPEAPDEALRLERNFFSALFLAALGALGMPRERRRLYGLVSQCMRAWVTACDNLLDDEDRAVFPLRLGGKGYRFKAVLTIMAAERVLSARLLKAVGDGQMTSEQAVALERASLDALVASGVQEHGEEGGIAETLPPAQVLERIHSIKTGRLFEAPVRVAQEMGEVPVAAAGEMRRGLHEFGLGCQILDDMSDVRRDLLQARHNYVLSVLAARSGEKASRRVREAFDAGQDPSEMLATAMDVSAQEARRRMETGLAVISDAGLPLDAAAREAICESMFPLLLTKDAGATWTPRVGFGPSAGSQ